MKHIKSKGIMKGRPRWGSKPGRVEGNKASALLSRRGRVHTAPRVTHCPASNFLPSARKCTMTHNSKTTKMSGNLLSIKIKEKRITSALKSEWFWNRPMDELETHKKFGREERSDQKVTLAYHHSSALQTTRGTTVGISETNPAQYR